jgi:hypothetical protein
MNNSKNIAFTLMILSGMVFKLSAQTIKERVDEARSVKVYFEISGVAFFNVPPIPKGTVYSEFKPSPLPASYTDEVKLVVDMLNKGFNSTAFIAGDISTVPVKESGMEKGYPDWLKLGEQIVFVVALGGTYNVHFNEESGKVSLTTNMEIYSGVKVYAPESGKVKTLSTKRLGHVTAPTKKVKTYPDYEYFLTNFPLADYFDKFKAKFERETSDFIGKEMENYDKAMMMMK